MRPWALALALLSLGACDLAEEPAAPGDAAVDDGVDGVEEDATEFVPDVAAEPAARREYCNGLDDDGDGLFDEVSCGVAYPCADPARCTCGTLHEHCGDECLTGAVPHGTCEGRCARFESDEHCGACGATCTDRSTCTDGQCVCPGGVPRCGGRCLEHNTDVMNCGSCGRACSAGLRCLNGACRCGVGEYCDGGCVDMRVDPQNCGRCGNACPAETTCVAGACRCDGDPSRQLCEREACVDTRSDRAHCGECFRRCGAGQSCRAGACACDEGLTSCGSGSGCLDLRRTLTSCGACFRACPSGATACVEGACVCPGARGAACDGACVDLGGSVAHCGRCGNACAASEGCVEGACRALLASPALGARVGNRRPRFWWSRGEGEVDICEDRACARVAITFVGSAERGDSPPTPLRPGVWFWRFRPRGVARADGGVGQPFRVDARDAARPALLPSHLDVNADGLADLAVFNAAGQVRLFLGRSGGVAAAPDREVRAEGVRAEVVWRAAGDVSSDGYGDLAVTTALQTRVFLGAAGAVSALAEDPMVRSQLVPALDVNRDGYTDWRDLGSTPGVVYGARGALGSAAPLRPGLSSDPRATAPLGDVNGDGYLDVAMGAPSATSPRAYVYFGSTVGLDRSVTLPPSPRSAGYGGAVAAAGDVNGDGLADVLVGLGASGAVVYLGGVDELTLHRTLLDAAGDDLLVAAAGDLDGDGFSDLAAVPRARGEVWIYRGSRAGLTATPVVVRDARWTVVEALGGGADLDGDGFDDLAAGAPSRDAVYVFYGAAALPWAREATLRGEAGSDFGRDVL